MSQYSSSASMPTALLPNFCAAISVVPEPTKGSSTVSPGSVKSLMNHSGKLCGKAALWFLLPHSVARCRTLVGYAKGRSSQLAMFLPKPLPTCESKRTTSFLPSDFRRASAQSPIGTMTACWFILNLRALVKCRQRSQASLKRFGHFPG